MAFRETWVKYRAGDGVVRVRVDAVAWFGRLGRLERPGAPMADVGVGLGGFVGHGVRVVGVSRAGAVGRREVACGGDAGRGDEVGGRCGEVAGGVGDVGQADGDVVAVDEGDV